MVEILALAGPSGIGKGFIKKAIVQRFGAGFFIEPVVATTRPRRPDDGPDRLPGIPLTEFWSQVEQGEIILNHQPFGVTGHWYGFLSATLNNTSRPVLTEFHVDNIVPARNQFGNRLILIGLVATDDSYLRENIANRSGDFHEATEVRVQAAKREGSLIAGLHAKGLINVVFEAKRQNKQTLRYSVTDWVSNRLT